MSERPQRRQAEDPMGDLGAGDSVPAVSALPTGLTPDTGGGLEGSAPGRYAPVDPARPRGLVASHVYRPDVDGLRAIAILSVLGYHAYPELLPGGFVGVDVFFVISGFLITGNIIDGLTRGSFRLSDFYARRVRRIFPALLLVSAACLLFGWFVLLPDEYAHLGHHLAAGAVFVSNLALWREAGYFDPAADTKPLLHLWSLGVEEQFYILWPMLLALVWRISSRVPLTVIGLGATSFIVGLITLNRDSTAAFYFPLARFWELMIGAWLACTQGAKRDELDKRTYPHLTPQWANVVSGLGLLLIAAALVTLNSRSSFPGWLALVPTLGSFLVILASPQATVVRVFLSSPPMVFVGLISYPLYLWHWPLLSFARIVGAGAPQLGERLLLIGLSFLAAFLTYRLVESPLRDKTSRPRSMALLCVGMVLVAIAGLAIRHNRGLAWRFPNPAALRDIGPVDLWGPGRDRQAYCSEPSQDWRQTRCRLSSVGDPAVALWGDSHAQHLFPGIAELDRSRTWMLLSTDGCPPAIGINFVWATGDCRERSEAALDRLLADQEIKTVVLSFSSRSFNEIPPAVRPDKEQVFHALATSREFADQDGRELLLRGLGKSIRTLEADGKAVVLVLDVPELPFSPRDCLRKSRWGLEAACALSLSAVQEAQHEYRQAMRRLQVLHPSLRVFDPLPTMCPGPACRFRDQEGFLYRDSDHLSVRGSTLLAHEFLVWMSNTAPDTATPR